VALAIVVTHAQLPQGAVHRHLYMAGGRPLVQPQTLPETV